jgi:hypothetical protein
MKSIGDVWDSVADTIKERFGNPFVSAFMASWLLINFRITLTLLGDAKAEQKISFIENYLIKDSESHYQQTFLYPLLGTASYLLLVPLATIAAIYVQELATGRYSWARQKARGVEFLTLEQAAKQRSAMDIELKELHAERKRFEEEARTSRTEINTAITNWLHVFEESSAIGLEVQMKEKNYRTITFPRILDSGVPVKNKKFIIDNGIPEKWIKKLTEIFPSASSTCTLSQLDFDEDFRSDIQIFCAVMGISGIVSCAWQDHDPIMRPNWPLVSYLLANLNAASLCDE